MSMIPAAAFEIDESQGGGGGDNKYPPLPAGDYAVVVNNAELRHTNAGGQMIALRLEITAGEFTGRWVFANLNVVNNNSTAQNIARRQLNEILTAIGKPGATDTDEMVGARLMIKVSFDPTKEKYQNDVKKYWAANRARPAQPAQAPAPAPAQEEEPALMGDPLDEAAQMPTPPWAKKRAAA